VLEKRPTHWRLLNILKINAGASLPGPELASQLGISRTAVWKQIQKLTSIGYAISAHPRNGYQLLDTPDLLIPEEVLPNLTTTAFGRTYEYHVSVDSTNDRLLLLAMQGALHGTVVVAEEQTRGKGRLGRQWLSGARQGIYMSVLLTTPQPANMAHQATLLAAISLVTVLKRDHQLSAHIKWPNDVLIRSRKVCGILTEVQSDQDLIRFLVLGIGINVNHRQEDFQGPLRYPATSLAIESGVKSKRSQLMAAFLNQFEVDYNVFLQNGFKAFLREFEQLSSVLGRTVTIHCGKIEHRGEVKGFTDEGALRLATKDGEEKVIWVGDVTQVEGNKENRTDL